MTEIGTLLQNRYLIEKKIGAGGMGAVYLAVDQKFDSPVAIKETFYRDDELGEAFQREARLLNSLFHPVLPYVSDYFTEGGGHFLVMQFVEGEDISETLKRERSFPVADVLRWTDNLLDALDYLHSQEPPIIHRDIKPQNLKITPRGDVILLDFGLAKLSASDTTGASAVSVFGYSRKYSPLEQIEGTGTDARSDLFALAATSFHLLTGEPPADALARAAAIISGKPDPLRPVNEINPDVPSGFGEVLRTALALDAERRFVSAKAMRLALENALRDELPMAVETTPIAAQAQLPTDETETSAATDAGIAAAAVVTTPVADFAENENFAAIAPVTNEAEILPVAFTETEMNGAAKIVSPEIISLPIADDFILSKPEVSPAPQEKPDAGEETRVRGAKRSRISTRAAAAAVALLLLISTLAAWLYFKNDEATEAAGAAQTSGEEISSTTDLSDKESAAPPPAAAAVVPIAAETPLISVTPAPKSKSRETQSLPSKIENPSGESETRKDQTVETAPEAPVKREEQRQPASQNPARKTMTENAARRPAPQNKGGTNNRVLDLEAIFTGRTREQEEQIRMGERRERRVQRKRRSEMSEEEWIEERRERRKQRRNNRPYFPY